MIERLRYAPPGFWRCVVAFFVLLISFISVMQALARDLGQWENTDPEIRAWYRSLMQPDNPQISCCGEADAYHCDAISVEDAQVYCTITDDRDDGPLGRLHVPIGTKILIPPYKYKFDRGNPTGHSIVFLSVNDRRVYCFIQGSGT